jgi:hypothetical protein
VEPAAKRRPGRPKGSKGTVRYRELVAREAIKLVVPVEAPPEVHALGREARGIVLRALRSSDSKAFVRPRAVAALYVLGQVCRRATVFDLMHDMMK